MVKPAFIGENDFQNALKRRHINGFGDWSKSTNNNT